MGSGTRRAVVIGINSYANVGRLAGCVRDATDVADALTGTGYDFQTVLVVDDDATRRKCLDELWSAAEAEGEFLVVYFAGHGLVHGGAGHLVTTEGVPRDPGIGLLELGHIMASASQNYAHVIAVLDSCHSGAGITWSGYTPLTQDAIEHGVAVVNASRILLAACRAEQVAFETAEPDARGAFTKVLVEGLHGGAVNHQGDVTVHSLFDFLDSNMDTLRQTPVFKGDSAGSVVLGTGFSPRLGAPVPTQEANQIFAKAESLLDTYQLLQTSELSRLDHRRQVGLRTCAQKLSEVVRWFDETENLAKDVARDARWRGFRSSLLNYQASLSNLNDGDVLPVGKVERRIGGGGFGQVWEVESQGHKQALKVFHGSELSDPVKPTRFRNGYYSMRSLTHPRIVAVHELTEAPLGFTMDLIQGADLRDAYIDRTDSRTLLALLIDIADTVRFAHGRSIVHRDIKPENVILAWDETSGEPAAHLTDFDLAYIETNRTVTVNLVGGAVNYAAPEQFYASNGSVARDFTVDVFGFAQLMYFILHGSDPAADKPAQNTQRFSNSVAGLFPAEPAELLIGLYKQSSSVDPSGRPQTMEEVHAVLSRAKVLHEATMSGAQLTAADILRQVAFTYAGPGGYSMDDEVVRMESRAGTMQIEVRQRGVESDGASDFLMTFSVSQQFGIPGASSGGHARGILNQRIDKRLQRYPDVRRSAGKHGYFQTHLTIERVPLSTSGIAELSILLSEIIAAIEHVD
ncbi:protein kinase domain-containing protein [Microbacterium deminutum]|uniref:Protein kinase domain-containing protein n=1 Tax=Microbacterium deminutum TaxID=344164 RepID=A0ABN2RK98_9MICO